MAQSGSAGAAPVRTVPAWTLAVPVAVVLIAVTVAAGMVLLDQSPRTPWVAPGPAKVGEKAPDFHSWDLAGRQVSLSDYRGEPVLLTFWATSCTACQDEFPTLQSIQRQFQDTGFKVLAIDYRETNTRQMQQFLDRLKVDFRGVIDPQGAIAWAYQVDIGLPVNVWLDRNHVVGHIALGEETPAQLFAAASSDVR